MPSLAEQYSVENEPGTFQGGWRFAFLLNNQAVAFSQPLVGQRNMQRTITQPANPLDALEFNFVFKQTVTEVLGCFIRYFK